jgi:hypothetical protein
LIGLQSLVHRVATSSKGDGGQLDRRVDLNTVLKAVRCHTCFRGFSSAAALALLSLVLFCVDHLW